MDNFRDKLRYLKKSCWGIGLSDIDNPENFGISGTGFAIDPEGFILTASHVINGLMQKREKLKREKNIKCAITAIQVVLPEKRGHPLILKRGLMERRHITITPTPNHPLPSNYDVVICRMVGKYDLKDYLQIKKPCKLETFDEVLCCGYPGGDIGAFNAHDLESGLRFSPTIQSGRIASVLPIDDVVNPTGIMTDIIGIGGLSGSPIVNAQDYEVIAIAQNVILADVFKNNKSVAKSKIGLVYGISNYVLSRAIDTMLPTIKKELDENGKLKPEFKKKYSDENTTDDFVIKMS